MLITEALSKEFPFHEFTLYDPRKDYFGDEVELVIDGIHTNIIIGGRGVVSTSWKVKESNYYQIVKSWIIKETIKSFEEAIKKLDAKIPKRPLQDLVVLFDPCMPEDKIYKSKNRIFHGKYVVYLNPKFESQWIEMESRVGDRALRANELSPEVNFIYDFKDKDFFSNYLGLHPNKH